MEYRLARARQRRGNGDPCHRTHWPDLPVGRAACHGAAGLAAAAPPALV